MRRLWRSVLDRVAPYDAGKSLEALARELGIETVLRLSANENPVGPSPRAIAAIRREDPRAPPYPAGARTETRSDHPHGASRPSGARRPARISIPTAGAPSFGRRWPRGWTSRPTPSW